MWGVCMLTEVAKDAQYRLCDVSVTGACGVMVKNRNKTTVTSGMNGL